MLNDHSLIQANVNDDPYGSQRDQMVLPTDKGFAFLEKPISLKQAAEQHWNLLDGDVLFPMLSIDQRALDHNIQSMSGLAQSHRVLLAPHAKTTMSPEIIQKQIKAGAWAVTAATLSQVLQLIHMQCHRIILANGLLDSKSILALGQWQQRFPELDLYCFVDSIDMVKHIESTIAQSKEHIPLKVFVELGIEGHRTGCRNAQEVSQLIEVIEASANLQCLGLAGYEGLIKGPWLECKQRVMTYLDSFFEIAENVFKQRKHPTYLSLGGSAYYDLVLQSWATKNHEAFKLIIRPGSYITHDHGHYMRVQNERRTDFDCPSFKPALTLWSKIQSIPEEGLAILNMGRRDVAMEAEFPIPLKYWKADKGFQPLEGCHIYKTNDQHSYMKIPKDCPLEVGDLILSGISHPSLAFDKWKIIPMIDEHARIVEFCHTCF